MSSTQPCEPPGKRQRSDSTNIGEPTVLGDKSALESKWRQRTLSVRWCQAFDELVMAAYPGQDPALILPWHASEQNEKQEAAGAEASSTTASKPKAAPAAGSSRSSAAGPATASNMGHDTSASSHGSNAASASANGIVPLPDLSKNGRVERFKDKWECAKQEDRTAPASNLFIAAELDKLGDIYKSQGSTEQTWKSYALSKQAKKLRGLEWEVTLQNCSRLEGIDGFGKKGCAKVRELLQCGELQRLNMLKDSDMVRAIEALTKIHGVGAATAKEWYARGITTVDEAVRRGILNAQQLVGARHWRDLTERIPRDEVAEIVCTVRKAVEDCLVESGVDRSVVAGAADAIGAGSFRRGKPDSGDVDVLITRRDGGPDGALLSAVIAQLQVNGCSMEHLTHESEFQHGGLRGSGRTAECHSYRGVIRLPGNERLFRRLDLKVYPVEEFAYALLYFTGSDHFNRSMRHYAKARGYSLSDHGIVNATKVGGNNVVRGTKNLFPAPDEESIFAALSLEYVPPEKRNTDIKPIGAASIEHNRPGTSWDAAPVEPPQRLGQAASNALKLLAGSSSHS